jgi:AcrR family transcriptional regulator
MARGKVAELEVVETRTGDYNFTGQKFGKKGLRIRDSLLDAARQLMVEDPLTTPTLTAVTARAGVKITSVYRYYPDINNLLANAMLPAMDEIRPMVEFLEQDWPQGKEFQRALEFARMLYGFWRERRGMLFVRNSLAERGDPRFVKLRLDWARPMLQAISDKLSKAHGRQPMDPRDMAAARILLPGLERTLTMLLQSQTLEGTVLSEDVTDPVITFAEVLEGFAHITASMLKHDYWQA